MKAASLTLHFKSIRDLMTYIEDHNMNPVPVSKESYELKVSIAKSAADTDIKMGLNSKPLCQECGHEFEPKQDRSKFCSQRCAKRHYMKDYFKNRIRINGKYVLREEEKPVAPVAPVIESDEDDEPEPDHKSGKQHKQGVRSKETFYNGLTDMP